MPSFANRARRVPLVAAALTLTLVAAGCGDGLSDPPDETDGVIRLGFIAERSGVFFTGSSP